MGFFTRLLGRRQAEAAPPSREPPSPLSLQLLFPGRFRLDINSLSRSLRGFHPSLAPARFELDARAGGVMDAEVGTARWGTHAVQVVLFNGPMPAVAVERCVAPAHYGAELKAQARAHGSHALLFYRGEEREPLEQYVALALVAVALAAEGALVVMNESGRTSFPAGPLVPEPGDDMLDLLRTLPLTALYVGFVKQEVAGGRGVWMRTYGAPRLGLPDLALHARGHDEGREAFHLFSELLASLRASGARFKDGDTAELDARRVRLRKPLAEEAFLDSQGELFVLESR